MSGSKILRFSDYETRSREPDAVDRDLFENPAVIIIFPTVHVERVGTKRKRRREAARRT